MVSIITNKLLVLSKNKNYTVGRKNPLLTINKNIGTEPLICKATTKKKCDDEYLKRNVNNDPHPRIININA